MTSDTPPEVGPILEHPVEMTADHITRSTRDPRETADRFLRWLAGVLPSDSNPVIMEVVSPESTGMSSETHLISTSWTDRGVSEVHRLAVRIEPPSDARPVFTTYDLGRQFRVMALVRDHTTVPVPDTYWYEPDPEVLGGTFFVMNRVDGLVPPDVLPYTFGGNWVSDASAAERRALQGSVIRSMAGIHSLTPDAFDLEFLQRDAPGSTALERSLAYWHTYHDSVVGDAPSPLLTECFEWLADNIPSDVSGDALSWGDGRIGNMMFRDQQVVAVLDWEMAEIAPPEVDLGWLCYLHLFFHDLAVQLGTPGLPDMLRPSDVRQAYAEATGQAMGDLRWHMTYAAVRHALNMRRVAERAIFFGEASQPDDIDDLIMHRATLREMLDGSYWSDIEL
jgi:aminoglycoside phosphotransferase (APT) family kinase protein